MVDCFKGQPSASSEAVSYRIDPGKAKTGMDRLFSDGFKNADLVLSKMALLDNKQDFSTSGNKLQRHIYDYALTNSNIERQFVKELDTSSDVVVANRTALMIR